MFLCDKCCKKGFKEGSPDDLIIEIPNNLMSEVIMQFESENQSDSDRLFNEEVTPSEENKTTSNFSEIAEKLINLFQNPLASNPKKRYFEFYPYS